MGFSDLERKQMQGLFRDFSENLVQESLPEEIYEFLKSQGLLRQVRDYGKFPSKFRFKAHKAENVVLTFVMDENFSIFETLNELKFILTPPFIVKIDCAFLMEDTDGDLKYVWPQRNLAINKVQHIDSSDDLEDLMGEIKQMETSGLMQKVCEIHQNQSCFDRSGYRPLSLLTTAIYLSKTGV